MWNEFIAGTGCRDTEHNYKVYKDLETMYMNSDLTKEDIYSYGIRLVDNSLTSAEIEHNERINAEIIELKAQVLDLQAEIKSNKSEIEFRKAINEPEWVAYYKVRNKGLRKEIAALNEKIRWTRECLITESGSSKLLQAR